MQINHRTAQCMILGALLNSKDRCLQFDPYRLTDEIMEAVRQLSTTNNENTPNEERNNTMKKLVNVVEVADEGLTALLGQKVLLLCANYFYTGRLTGVNDSCVQLSEPSIVYETGPWTNKTYTDAQDMQVPVLYVQTASIEAFCVAK